MSVVFVFNLNAKGSALSMMTFALRYLDEKNGQRSMIKSFLSVEIWQPLQKLTFLIYICHPIVGYWYQKDRDIPLYNSIWSATANICTFVTVTAVFSFFLYVFMEQPLALFISSGVRRILGKPKRMKLKRTQSELLRVVKHHPSTGAGTVDMEPSVSSSDRDLDFEDESDSDLDGHTQTEDDLGIASTKPTVQ